MPASGWVLNACKGQILAPFHVGTRMVVFTSDLFSGGFQRC